MQLVINEITSSAPQALQAVKLLAQYQGNKLPKVMTPQIVGSATRSSLEFLAAHGDQSGMLDGVQL